MTHYFWWIPCSIIYYCALAWTWKQINDTTDTYQILNLSINKWMVKSYILGALCPIWVIVAKISNNLMLDGIIYDYIMFLTFTFMMVILGAGSKFAIHQWVGVGLAIVAVILMRLELPVK